MGDRTDWTHRTPGPGPPRWRSPRGAGTRGHGPSRLRPSHVGAAKAWVSVPALVPDPGSLKSATWLEAGSLSWGPRACSGLALRGCRAQGPERRPCSLRPWSQGEAGRQPPPSPGPPPSPTRDSAGPGGVNMLGTELSVRSSVLGPGKGQPGAQKATHSPVADQTQPESQTLSQPAPRKCREGTGPGKQRGASLPTCSGVAGVPSLCGFRSQGREQSPARGPCQPRHLGEVAPSPASLGTGTGMP